MKCRYAFIIALAFAMPVSGGAEMHPSAPAQNRNQAAVVLKSDVLAPDPTAADKNSLRLDGFFYETQEGRVALPAEITEGYGQAPGKSWEAQSKMTDGRMVTLAVARQNKDFTLRMSAQPDDDIIQWGVSISSIENEYFTGLMERVVDGPQQASWAPGLQTAMNLRGQKVDMIVKPTTSVYAPFYLSS